MLQLILLVWFWKEYSSAVGDKQLRNLSRVRGFLLDSGLKGHSPFKPPWSSLLYPRDNNFHRAHWSFHSAFIFLWIRLWFCVGLLASAVMHSFFPVSSTNDQILVISIDFCKYSFWPLYICIMWALSWIYSFSEVDDWLQSVNSA